VTKPIRAKSMVSLQTCTLPDYAKRLVVRPQLVKEDGPSGGRWQDTLGGFGLLGA
jgi:hypothetical protein